MKKTQPIDWDKSYFDETISEVYCYIWDLYDNKEHRFNLDKDFIAAFDEMLEYEIKNRADKFPVVWDDVNGWKPLWIEVGSHYYLNNA